MSGRGELTVTVDGLTDPVLVTVSEDDDGTWMAEASDLDYAACGDSEEDALRRFEKGLALTVRANLEQSGSLGSLRLGRTR